LIDTHAHLHFPQFDNDRERVIKECQHKLDAVITVGCNLEDSMKAVKLADENDKIYASVGIHPHDAKNYSIKDLTELSKLAKNGKVVALGEMGLDFYRNISPRDKQFEIFKAQIELARELDLPVIIHTREASEEMAKFIDDFAEGVKGVIHCFNGNIHLMESALKKGFYISYAGPITYPKNSKLRETLKSVPSSRLLSETDSPYLSPQKFRGKRNKPPYVAYVLKEISEYLKVNFSDIDRITTVNAKRLFNIPMTKEESEEKLVYKVSNNLYINLTTRCPCNCSFCFRGKENFILGYNLNLSREPIPEEYMYRIKNPSIYDEIVFCGYGEPFERFDALLKIAEWVKKMGARKVRVNTCGLGYLITGRNDILDKMVGLVDAINVSINACNPETYYEIVKPKFGKGSFESVIKFIKSAREKGFEVKISAVKHEKLNETSFKEFARKLGVGFKIRERKLF